MKRRFFIIALLTAVFVSANAWAGYRDDGIHCEGKTITYNDDGTVTVKWDWDDEGTTYDSIDDMYLDFYGFLPPKTLAESGYDQYFNISSPNNNSSNNNNGSVKQRGRLIYTVKEATEIAKDTGNTVRLRYK